MDLGLSGKIAIVGGASQGIGFAIARTLASEGATVAMTARREAQLVAAAERIRSETGATVLPLAADSRRAEDCLRVAATVLAQFGGVDVLVNNDGAPPLGRLEQFDDTAWSKAVEQNLMYVVRMSREVLPSMRSRGGGSILNIAAVSAIQPIAEFGLSVSTWAGMIGYAKTLSVEVAEANINVNTICPGYIATPRIDKVFGPAADDASREKLLRDVPMRRLGHPDEIANLAALLVSARGRYITGTAIQVDGGMTRATR